MSSTQQNPPHDLAPTGISGLDAIFCGGFPRGHLYLLEGTPGAGKTTLALQFLLEGARRGERCLYVTLSETERELRAVANSHGWSLDAISLLELVPLEADLERQQGMIHPSEVDLGETAGLIQQKVDELRPDRLVIDALTELRLLAQDPLSYRRQTLALKQFFARRETTVLALDDLTDPQRGLQLHSVVHGVLTLEQRRMEYGVVRRRLSVSKLRGVDFRSGYHDYVIRTGGLTVFESLVAAHHGREFPTEAVSSELAEVDDLLGGGLRRGTSTLIIGPSGVGKSSLAMRYAMAATGRGERAAVFAFEESYRTAAERALGLGMGMDAAIDAGLLRWEQVNPAILSPGEFVDRVKRRVDNCGGNGARLVVIDSLNSYIGSMPEEQALTLHLHELLAYLGNQGVTTILIMAQHGLVGDTQAPLDISFLADTVILLRYFEAEGQVRKAISVLKNRSGRHETTIREYRLADGGISVGSAIREFQGVLTGVPTYVGAPGTLSSVIDTTAERD
ncbi:MAG TPA: ATPase domain-containing protein [Stellaceae bacterium]